MNGHIKMRPIFFHIFFIYLQGDQGGPLICEVGGRTDVVVGIGLSIFSFKISLRNSNHLQLK